MKYLFHFAMMKECPTEFIKLPEDVHDDLSGDDIVGLFDTIYPNIKFWVSGVGCNNVLYPDYEVIDYLKTCDYVYSFGLSGSINDNLKVGDLVNVHSVNNLDVKIPGYGLGCTDDFDADCLGCSKSNLTALSDFNTRVICYTSNRFVTKEYLDFLFGDTSDDDLNDFYEGAFNQFAAKNYLDLSFEDNFDIEDMVTSLVGFVDEPKEDCIVCEMELFYLKKLVDIVNKSCNVCAYKLVSDVVCKPDNYEEYEGSLQTLLSSLHFTVGAAVKELGLDGE